MVSWATCLRLIGLSVIAVWLSAASSIPEPPEIPTWLDLPRLRAELLQEVNTARRKAGLPPVRPDVRLDCAAQEHAENMAIYSYYAHKAPGGPDLGQRAWKSGYRWAALAENIMERVTTVEAAMDAWLGSKPHRRNILNPRYTEMGIGIALKREGAGYRVVWVQDFGTR